MVNLTNVDHVYTSDPKTTNDFEVIKEIKWADFRKRFHTEFRSGLHSPFDPVAAMEAEKIGLEVAVMDGKNLLNLRNYLDGKDFVGTKIH